MNLNEALARLPDTDKKVVVVHSGGLDSSTALILAARRYGSKNVLSLGFNYGQKQVLELSRAEILCEMLEVNRYVIDLPQLGEIVKGVTSNIVGSEIAVPTIKEVLGDPAPVTEIPFRNMILFSLGAAYAESNGADTIVCGLQSTDQYSYWDTTLSFVESINSVFSQNRKHKITLISPFGDLSKTTEVQLLIEADSTELLKHTLTCYNPNEAGESCGACPSCAERIKAFMDCRLEDPIPYSINIPWKR